MISDRELRLSKRNNDISTTTLLSFNEPSTIVQKDPKGPFEDESTEAPVTDPDVVKLPPIQKNVSSSIPKPQRRPRIASKAALTSIGKIAHFEQMNSRKCSSSSTHNEDESSIFN